MNRRGFFAALAGLPLAPIALKANPIEGRRAKALALSSEPRGPYPVPDLKLRRAWFNGHWVPIEEWTEEEKMEILRFHKMPISMRRVKP